MLPAGRTSSAAHARSVLPGSPAIWIEIWGQQIDYFIFQIWVVGLVSGAVPKKKLSRQDLMNMQKSHNIFE